MPVYRSREKRVRPSHYIWAAVCQVVVEIVRPRRPREWIDLALSALELIPAMRVPVTVVSLIMQWRNRDYRSLVLSLAEITSLPSAFKWFLQALRRAQRFGDSVLLGTAVARRAQRLAA